MYKKLINNPTVRSLGAKLQNFIGTDLRYLTKNGAVLFVGQILVSLAMFGFTWVLANYVSKELVGQYRFVLSAQVVLSIIALSGLSTALSKSVAEGYDSSLKAAFKVKLKFGLYAGIASLLVGVFYYFTQHDIHLFWGFVIVALSIPLYESTTIIYSYLQGKKDFYRQALYSSLIRVSVIAVSAVVCVLGTNLVLLLLINFFLCALLQLWAYKNLIKRINTEVGPIDTLPKDSTFISLGIHFTIMGILFAVVSQLDRFILFQFFGAATLATYWIATTIPLELQRILTVVGSLSFPKFVNKEKEVIQKTLPRKLFIAAGCLAVAAFAYIWTAPWIFQTFFPEYIESVLLSQIFVVSLIFMPHLFIWQYFAAVGNKKILYIYHIVDPTIQIILYICLIPFLGVWGLVWTAIAKTAILSVMGLVFLHKH